MLLAAMLAMVLVAAAPALAQATVTSDEDIDNSVNQTVTSDVVLDVVAEQSQFGDANAAADDGSADASISQMLTTEQSVVQSTFVAGGNIHILFSTDTLYYPFF